QLPDSGPELSIVVPAYNEAARLPLTLPKLIAYCKDRANSEGAWVELIVVDDGSTDATAALVETAAAQRSFIRLLRNPGNRGKGYSVRAGMREAAGRWILITDADLSSPLEEVET